MSPDPDETQPTAAEAIGGIARHAAKQQTGRWLVYATAVGLIVLMLAFFFGGWWIVNITRDNSRDIAHKSVVDAAQDAQNKSTKDQIDTLRSQLDAINAKRKQSGLPPIKKVAPDVTNEAPGSDQTKQNTQLVAQLAAALIPVPKDGKKGATGKAGPVGVSVSRVSIVNCTLAIGTSDGNSYAGSVCGPPGKVGPQGIQGVPGEAGASAYALWLGAGHTGTVADFLASLKGSNGRGVVAIGMTDTSTAGCQQVTVQYSDDPAAKPIGDPICNGATGATGPQGPQGDKGDTGDQGLKGDKGDPGTPPQTYVVNHADGSVETCTLQPTVSNATPPTYQCVVTTPPTSTPPDSGDGTN